MQSNDYKNKIVEANSPSLEGVSRSDGVVALKNIPYNPKLKERARELRKSGNIFEVMLWLKLKNKQLEGLDFYRQKIIGNYIVDFYCYAKQLVIEIDGNSHDDKIEYDKERDNFLKSLDLKVLHFTVSEIRENMESVLESILNS